MIGRVAAVVLTTAGKDLIAAKAASQGFIAFLKYAESAVPLSFVGDFFGRLSRRVVLFGDQLVESVGRESTGVTIDRRRLV